ncbi:hypothetical protein [Pseudoduganella umbonata]|uniref:Uncharacterized protein n=1 Tax=Pseudoduganella umbonata TaxID=864828 RepID=A0A4P8HZ32_9BURK|nr:hypothetical protein [Pseudoduganella umbonata]MBB3223421.1 hypothetical protein [Pseudoduganella umbonata]QCP13685.1 hypothetical protein FCL38_27065 [Pseudoduganella umbonata]
MARIGGPFLLRRGAYFFTELSSALLGLLGEVPGVAVGDVLPDWFHWPEPAEPEVEPEVLEPDVLEPEVEPDAAEPAVPESIELLPDVVPEPVAELSPVPLVLSVVLHAARPKHRAAAKIALVMVMISSFFNGLIGDSSFDRSIRCNRTAFHYPSKTMFPQRELRLSIVRGLTGHYGHVSICFHTSTW